MSLKRRVVVTGLGMITPLGVGVKKNWEALAQGRSGISKITKFDPSRLSSKIAGEVKDFKIDDYLSLKESRRLDPFSHYGIAAAKMAIQDAGLEVTEANAEKVGVIVGSGIGGLQSIVAADQLVKEKGPDRLSPFFILQAICNILSGYISIRYGIKGPNSCVVTACATGAHAIGDAFRHIQMGTADVMIAGGADAAICELGIAGFTAMRALSTRNEDPEKASRPFDQERDGFVMAEGAGVIVLEEFEVAKKRGAKIHAEVLGYALNADASHLTAPSPNGEGAARCMELALKDAGIHSGEIDYINAHGTSTPHGDIAETNAIKTVFKEQAKKVSISSTKSMTGHLLGAAGGVEAIYSILSIQHQVVPPTINLDHPDPLCDLDYTPHASREKKITTVLSNSFGFGGTNAVLIFRRGV